MIKFRWSDSIYTNQSIIVKLITLQLVIRNFLFGHCLHCNKDTQLFVEVSTTQLLKRNVFDYITLQRLLKT